MSKKVVAKKKAVVVERKVQAGNDSIFFKGQFSGTNAHMTDKEWVTYMNEKYGTKWNGRD